MSKLLKKLNFGKPFRQSWIWDNVPFSVRPFIYFSWSFLLFQISKVTATFGLLSEIEKYIFSHPSNFLARGNDLWKIAISSSILPGAPGKIDELIAIFHKSLPLARKLDGCEKIYFSISDNNPNVAVTFEIWKSKKDQEKYIKGLTENGTLSQIQLCLNGFPKFNFFNNLDNF